MTGIDQDGYTHRRCGSKHQHANGIEFPNDMYAVCQGDSCNTEIFPENRLQCYRCNGEKECDFMPPSTPAALMPCGVFSEFDQCYAYLAEDNKIYRGCLSDASKYSLLCEQNHPNTSATSEKGQGICLKCGESGCNDVPRTKPSSISCVHCTKSEECAFGQNEQRVIACKGDIQFGTEESCYTHYNYSKLLSLITIIVCGNISEFVRFISCHFNLPDNESRWAVRGCTVDLTEMSNLDDSLESVKTCSETGCNDRNVLHSYCMLCTSDLKGKCAEISDPDVHTTQCKGTYPYEKRGCYTLTKKNTKGMSVN